MFGVNIAGRFARTDNPVRVNRLGGEVQYSSNSSFDESSREL
jgi:hypothetical protein